MEFRRRHLKSVEYLDLKVGEGETKTNVAEETPVQHHVVGCVFTGARAYPLIGISALSLVQINGSIRDFFLVDSPWEMHGFSKFSIRDM